MKVSFLNSRMLGSKLPRLINSCNQLDVCIAYVKIRGLYRLLSVAKELIDMGGTVRILFGMSRKMGITDKESVDRLLDFSVRTKSEVRRYDFSGFHPKMYIFHGTPPRLIVGSSNLTEAAMEKNVEANLLVEDPEKELFNNVKTFFKEHFEKALPLTSEDKATYSPMKRRGRGGGRKGYQEDEPPEQQIFGEIDSYEMIGELLNQLGKNRFYIMHLSYGYAGKRRECWEFATKHDCLGLSHRKVAHDWIKVKKKIRGLSSTWSHQFNIFYERMIKDSIKVGDVVLVLCGQSHLLGVAEVTGDHEFNKEYGEMFFDHIRPVSWIKKYDYVNRLKIPPVKGFRRTLDIVESNSDRWGQLIKIKL